MSGAVVNQSCPVEDKARRRGGDVVLFDRARQARRLCAIGVDRAFCVVGTGRIKDKVAIAKNRTRVDDMRILIGVEVVCHQRSLDLQSAEIRQFACAVKT